MKKSAIAITTVILVSLGALPCSARNLAAAPASTGSIARSDLTPVSWYYDGRDDVRDFPTNGFFPGDFAADPAGAAIGAAGIFGSAPYRIYPSQSIDGSKPNRSYCVQRFRSYEPASSAFVGYDSRRHRCQ